MTLQGLAVSSFIMLNTGNRFSAPFKDFKIITCLQPNNSYRDFLLCDGDEDYDDDDDDVVVDGDNDDDDDDEVTS